jgi:FKBP-type peptidyl-prolyl cis-trans isomerase
MQILLWLLEISSLLRKPRCKYLKWCIVFAFHTGTCSHGLHCLTTISFTFSSHKDANEVTPQEANKKNKKQKTQEANKSEKQAETGIADSGSKESFQTRTFGNGMIIQELEMGKPDGKRATRGKKV